jgi:hypothetical protein
MRYVIGLIFVLALGAMPLVACGEDACQSDGDCDDGRECSEDYCVDGNCAYNLAPCPCQAPLSDYCTGSDCPNWSESVANAMAFCGACEFPHAVAGRCGDFGYVRTVCGPYGPNITEYFDAMADLVAAARWDDNATWCGFAFTIEYGPVPDCEQEAEQILCE